MRYEKVGVCLWCICSRRNAFKIFCNSIKLINFQKFHEQLLNYTTMKAPALFYFIFQFALSLVQSKVIKIGALFTNALVNPQDSGRDEIRSARLAVDVLIMTRTCLQTILSV